MIFDMSKINDLTGIRFGRLVVKRQDGRSNKGQVRWLCQCDCGNTKTVDAYSLRSGNTRSCGCLEIENRYRLREDIVGRRFGRLTVVGLHAHKPVRYICKCDCGNETIVEQSNLKTNTTTSCGCRKREVGLESAKDLNGRVFGYLTVLGRHGTIGSRASWLCRCECGNTTVVTSSHLLDGHTTSCGCKIATNKGYLEYHGMSHTKLYGVYSTMMQRCNNSNDKAYAGYGGRGIKVCDEWSHSFTSFATWALSNGYGDGLSIDRIDNDGNYCPENCRWTTIEVQSNNRRVTKYRFIDGDRVPYSYLVKTYSISRAKLDTVSDTELENIIRRKEVEVIAELQLNAFKKR